jgi:hypothetical protein
VFPLFYHALLLYAFEGENCFLLNGISLGNLFATTAAAPFLSLLRDCMVLPYTALVPTHTDTLTHLEREPQLFALAQSGKRFISCSPGQVITLLISVCNLNMRDFFCSPRDLIVSSLRNRKLMGARHAVCLARKAKLLAGTEC